MSYNMAFRICTTCVSTRILAFFVDTSLVLWTFVAENTFRSAVWRTSDEVWLTRTYRTIAFNLTNRVHSTRGRFTWIFWCLYRRFFLSTFADNKWISFLIWSAATDWIVVQYFTPGSDTACSWAWINAFQIDTSLVLRTFGVDHTFRLASRWYSSETWQT